MAHGGPVEVRFLIGPVAGIVHPKGDLRAGAKRGSNLGLTSDIMLGKHFSVGTDFAYTRFGEASHTVWRLWNGQVDSSNVWRQGYIWRLTMIGAHGTCFLNSSWPLSPFVKAGEYLLLTRRYETSTQLWGGRANRGTFDRAASGFSIGTGVTCRLGKRIRATMEGAYNEFDRFDEIPLLWGPEAIYPTLNYWSLEIAVEFYFGAK
jgi:hypothetical protein